MRIGQTLLPEFDAEMANTRRALAQVPHDRFEWKIHHKSNSLGWVANHLADIPSWVDMSINQDAFDIEPVAGKPYATPTDDTTQQVLERFDRNVAQARTLLEAVSDEHLLESWKLLRQGQELMSMPRLAVVRMWVLNHSIHHRGCLCVYLRVNDIPVPGMYGPSGDDSS